MVLHLLRRDYDSDTAAADVAGIVIYV